MKKKYIIFIATLIILIPFCIITSTIFLIIRKDKQESEILKKEYPWLSVQDSISGVIYRNQTKSGAYQKGASYIDLTNGKKIGSPYAPTINFYYKIHNFNDFIQPGDSIFKSADNDTIFIYPFYKSTVYYFVLGKIINEDYKMRNDRIDRYK